MVVRSGATGEVVFERNANGYWPYGGTYGMVLGGRAGTHADVRFELLAGVPSPASLGGVDVIFLPHAEARNLGGGCGLAGPPQPTLSMDPPKLGQLATLSLGNIPAAAGPVMLLVSQPTASPLLLGFGCEVHVDVPTASQLPPLTGNATLTLFFPDNPSLAGLSLHSQAFAFDNNAPLGIVLTNGLAVTVGY